MSGAALGIVGAAGAIAGFPVAGVLAGIGAVIAAVAAVSSVRRSAQNDAELDFELEILPPIVRDADPGVAGGAPPPGDSGTRLTDPETGLFSEDYFNVAIDARIAAARRQLRPIGVVVLEVVEGLRVGQVQFADPRAVAAAVKATLREADTACRRADGRFSLLLEDTPENGAIWTVERIRRALAEHDPRLTLWAGIACYPAHGFNSTSLVAKSELALGAAREWHQDRIEVAAGD